MVYVREAHPSDGWQLDSNVEQHVVFTSPQDYAEKSGVARICMRKLGLEFPALIDDFDNSVELAYTAWPDRLYLVDREGRIAYKARPGPFGFEPEELGAALERTVDTVKQRP